MADNKLKRLEFEQREAHHYNTIMWNLIYIGIGLSLWILYQVYFTEKIIKGKTIILLFGVIVLLYFNLIIEKSNKRKEKSYNYIEKNLTKEKLNNLFYTKGIYWFRIIIFLIYIIYAVLIEQITIILLIGILIALIYIYIFSGMKFKKSN